MVITLKHICCILILAAIAPRPCVGQRHPFTVKDDIEMARFSNPRSLPGFMDTEVAQRSPDGKYFVVVTTKGNLTSDLLESRIVIFAASDIWALLNSAKPHSISPRVLATLASFPHHHEVSSYSSVITDVRWSPDSRGVYYIGEATNGTYRLYLVGINGSAPVPLTPAGRSVRQYVVSGAMIIYREESNDIGLRSADGLINPDARAVTGESLRDILFSNEKEEDANEPKMSTLYVMRKRGTEYITRIVPHSSIQQITFAPYLFTPMAVSPNGQQVIELSPVASMPNSWEAYEPAQGQEHLRFHADDPRITSAHNIFAPRRYNVVNLRDGKRHTLIDAPDAVPLGYGYFENTNRIVWSKDGQRALITNTFLPLDHVAGPARTERLKPCLVASVEMNTFEAHCFLFAPNDLRANRMTLENLSFVETKDRVVLHVGTSNGQVIQRYSYYDRSWKVAEEESEDVHQEEESTLGGIIPRDDLQLTVEESLNNRPTLWVKRGQTGQSREIWDPNPQLKYVDFGEVSVYHWKDKTGYEWTGGLVKPVGYVEGRRYPLVLQMYAFNDTEFMTDGTATTAFAARELASNGIVVLQIRRKSGHTMNDAEAQEHLEGYRSAIEHLTDDGLVDPSKVGVVGFSWTCWYVENALIKSPRLFAAATVADGTTHSYMDYLVVGVANPDMQHQDERILGTAPFGSGLRRWIEMASGFNLDKVQTPLRIEAIKPVALLEEWEIYSSLRIQGKPVDLIYFPLGTHIHQRPLERLESQQGDVDWFRFWLQGYEDPDPAKHSEYERWEKLQVHRADRAATTLH